MLRRLTPQQFRYWQVYAELEPFDEIRADVRSAKIEAALYNINRDTKKHPKPFPLEDFLPDYDGERRTSKKQTVEDQKMVLKMIVTAYTGKRVDD